MIYKNARIFIDGDRVLENGFVLVEDGVIKDVGVINNKYEKKYNNFECVDLTNFSIYPGFIDAHTHIGMWETGLGFEGADGNEETDPITPQLRAIDAVNPSDVAFNNALKAGVTTVLTGPGSSNPIGGSFIALKTFGSCVDDMVIKNPVGIKFSLGENPKSTYNDKDMMPTTRMATAALIRENLEKARRYRERLGSQDEPDFDFKCESIIPLLERKVKAFFHCHRTDDIFTAIRLSKEFGLDFVLVHASQGHLIAKYLKGVDVVAGPIITDISKPELEHSKEYNACVLSSYGARVAICTDAPVLPIQYLNLSCALAIKNGLERGLAINAITKNAAKVCGIYNLVGSIETNKLANFVVFKRDEDIFSPYVCPSFVILDGEVVYRKI